MASSVIKADQKPTGFEASVNLMSYTSASNAYTIPKDGWLLAVTNANTDNQLVVNIDGTNLFSLAGGSKVQTIPVPVTAGMVVYVSTNTGSQNGLSYRAYKY